MCATGGLRSVCVFFFSSRRRHTRLRRDWSSDVCSSDLHIVCARGRGDTVILQSGVTIGRAGLADEIELAGQHNAPSLDRYFNPACGRPTDSPSLHGQIGRKRDEIRGQAIEICAATCGRNNLSHKTFEPGAGSVRVLACGDSAGLVFGAAPSVVSRPRTKPQPPSS